MENQNFTGADFATQVLFGKPLVKPEEKAPEQQQPAAPETIQTPLMKVEVKKDNPWSKINSETGFNFEKEEDLINALKKSKDFEKREEQYLKDNQLGNTYTTFFNSLPEDLKKVIVDYGSNVDYRQTIREVYGMGGVDYNKAWSEYDDKFKMISKYNSDVTAEDWEELDTKQQKIIENLAKKTYETERAAYLDNYKQREQNFTSQRAEYVKKLEKSIDKSIDNLRKNLPDMDEKAVNDVRSQMYQNPFRQMFNEDNTYTEDAATKIAFAYHGQETMSQLIQRMNNDANKAVQDATKTASQGPLEDYVKRMNDKVPENNERNDSDKRMDAIRETTKNLFHEPSSGFRNKQQ